MRTGLTLVALCAFGGVAAATDYEVGSGQAYSSPCMLMSAVTLQPGDHVTVDAGTYTDYCKVSASGSESAPITMTMSAGAIFDPGSADLSGAGSVPRAIFQFEGAYWEWNGGEYQNAQGSSGNGAAFRITAAGDHVHLVGAKIHGCQDGIMGDGDGAMTIEDSELYGNGANDGYTHNIYMSNDTVVLRGNYIHDSAGGQNVKLRARYAELDWNVIARGGNYEIDLIQGPSTGGANGNAVLMGNVVVRPADSGNNSQVILYGTDDLSQAGRNGGLHLYFNTFVMANSSNHLIHANGPSAGATIELVGNLIDATAPGTNITTDAGTDALVSGSSNWIANGITAPASLAATTLGDDPMFAGPASDDYSLTSASTALAAGGSVQPQFMDGSGTPQSGYPLEMMVEPMTPSYAPRSTNPPFAAGAYGVASTGGGDFRPADDVPCIDGSCDDNTGSGGGCCQTGSSGAASGVLLAFGVGLALSRRRRR
ncbi:MAG TPA: hypothetical protein VGM88_23595 [Kofleriaceae bacterium]|jgi:hypothetical protein